MASVDSPTMKPSNTITPQHVQWAYRLFLDREPENEQVLKRTANDTAALRREFLSSSEFQMKNTDLALSIDKWVIAPTKLGFRIFVALNELGVSRPILLDEYETPAVQLFQALIKPGERVLDIGANIGFHSMLLSTLVGATGEVLAFEPVKYLFDALVASIAENNFGDRCHAFNIAVSDYSGRGTIRYAPRTTNFGGGHLASSPSSDGHAYDTIEVVTLSSLLADRPCSFIKIDVEGAEAKVLQGGVELLRRDKPVVFVELFNDQLRKVSNSSGTEVISFMRDLGYRCFDSDTGAPGPEIREYDSTDLINVIFLPT
jgi:FkbM family methyltransferase